MKKLLQCICAASLLGMALFSVPVHAEEHTDDLWSYVEYENGMVSAILNDKTLTEVEVPTHIDGKPVFMVEVDCFNGCENLTTVKLPETITIIDDYAFYNCSKLEKLNIPAGLENIGFMAFYGCQSLPEMYIPAGVKEIELFAFEGCNSLKFVDVADGNKFYKDEDGILFDYDGTTLILYPSAKTDTAYTVPEGCNRVESYAFMGNTYLKNINIDHITELGEDAFYYCTSLEQISVPDGITELTGAVFGNCQSLRSVRLPADLTSIGNGCFYNCLALTELDVPETVTTIFDYAFFNCPLLKEIRLTKNTTSIGKYSMGFYYKEGAEPSRLPGFQVDADDNTAAFTYCVENSIKCTGGVTQGTVFIYIIAGVIALVIAATIAIIVIQKRIQKRYDIR